MSLANTWWELHFHLISWSKHVDELVNRLDLGDDIFHFLCVIDAWAYQRHGFKSIWSITRNQELDVSTHGVAHWEVRHVGPTVVLVDLLSESKDVVALNVPWFQNAVSTLTVSLPALVNTNDIVTLLSYLFGVISVPTHVVTVAMDQLNDSLAEISRRRVPVGLQFDLFTLLTSVTGHSERERIDFRPGDRSIIYVLPVKDELLLGFQTLSIVNWKSKSTFWRERRFLCFDNFS